MTESDPARVSRRADFRVLEHFRRKGIPFVHQLENSDCGAACLAMVLRYHGVWIGLDQARRDTDTAVAGTSGGHLLRAAQRHGLQGRGISIDVDDLRHLPRGSILHWDFNHFVVLDRVTRSKVKIIDPSIGPRTHTLEDVRKHFTGVAIELRPGLNLRRSKAPAHPMWSYFKSVLSEHSILRRALVTSVILRIVGLAAPLAMGTIVDRVIPKEDYDLLLAMVVGVAGIFVFQALVGIIRAHFLMQLQTNLNLRMTLGFVEHLVSLPYEFFQRRTRGDLMTRVQSNNIVRDELAHGALSTALDGFMVLLYIVLIAAIHLDMALLVICLAVVQSVVFLVVRSHVRDMTREILEARAVTQGNLLELIGGINSLKSCGSEGRAVERWGGIYVDEVNSNLRLGRFEAVAGSVSGVVGGLAYLFPLAYGATTVLTGDLSLGTMLALVALAGAVLGPIAGLLGVATSIQKLVPHVERIEDVRATAPEQAGSAVRPMPLRGDIELDDVSFTYEGATAPALSNVSLKVSAGSSVAVVGQSGAGKSTLANLMIGLYQPGSGTIRFDGQNLAHLDLRDLRSQLGVVPQTTRLFRGTYRENISMFDDRIPFEKLVAAAKLAEIHEEIVRMPMGYDCPMSEDGASLSGGQRQRVALARALVRRPPILLLDEASSSLDARTEAAIVNNIKKLRCTRIIIAHRLSTVINADMIVVVANGKIVDQGRHHELMEKGGVYRDLVHAQTTSSRQNDRLEHGP